MAEQSFTWVPKLRSQISTLMYRNTLDDDNQNFITRERLASAWDKVVDGKTFRELFRRDVTFFSTDDHAAFCDRWIRVVSILIWIRHEHWVGFLRNHMPTRWTRSESTSDVRRDSLTDGAASLNDKFLPFTKHEVREHLFSNEDHETEVPAAFYRSQYAFIPVVLKQDTLLDLEDKNYRLPLIEESSQNDTGSYGLVTKVKVAKGHYLYIPNFSVNTKPYPDDFYAARKEFEVGHEFAREHKNLEILRSSDYSHARITLHFTSAIIGTKYNLFFTWADLDLERFLHGSYLYDNQENSITPLALMSEALGLLGALQFLHGQIEFDGENVVFCHLDLKPSNILVTRDENTDQYPLGRWTITDFGISNVEPRREGRAQLVSVRELFQNTNRGPTTSPSSLDELERFPGPYQPPEAEHLIAERMKSQGSRTPGDMSDVWSYGCVILAVLAFALGGPQYTEILNAKLMEGDICPDGHSRHGRFYRGADQSDFQVNPYVQAWFEEYAARIGGWFLDIWHVVATDMLKIHPQDRKSAKSVAASLKPLIEGRIPQKNIWTDDLPTNPLQSHSDLRISSQLGSSTPVPGQNLEQIDTIAITPMQTKSQTSRTATYTSSTVVGSPLKYSDDTVTASSTSTGQSLFQNTDPFSPRSDQPSLKSRSDVSESILSQYSTKSFVIGASVDLEIAQEDLVIVSRDGSSILYRNKKRAKVFLASEENGSATFTSDGARSFPRNGTLDWDEVRVAGRYVALRKAVSRRDGGSILIYTLDLDHSPREMAFTSIVDIKKVNGMCLSSCGFVAFRFSRHFSIFDMSGSLQDVISQDDLRMMQDGVKRISFDTSGKNFIAISSDHWLLKTLTDGSDALTGQHEFRQKEFGGFDPAIVPFTNAAGFLLHDRSNPGRCAMIIPDLNNRGRHLEHYFTLKYRPYELTITPDNSKLVYVTIDKSKLSSKYRYILRSRDISVTQHPPIAVQDTGQMDLYTTKEKFDIGIAVVISSKGYAVLVALTNGVVDCFDLQ